MKELLITVYEFISLNLTLQVFLLIFSAVVVNYVVMLLLRKITLVANKTGVEWDDILIYALRRPLIIFLMYIACYWSAKLVQARNESPILAKFVELDNIAYLVIVGWFLMRFVKRAEVVYSNQDKFDTTTVTAITKLIRFSIFITTVIMVVDALGYSITGVLAFGGMGGIAVGFAARDLLANFFGGMIVYMDRPFKVGDWVRSPDKIIEGTVEQIGWRVTKIRTFDKRPIYVPNSVFTTIVIQNPSRMTHRRIKEVIGVRYEDGNKLPSIVAAVEDMLKNHPDIATDQTLMVNFDEFADSSLNFFIYTFTKTINWQRYHDVKQDVLFKIMDIIAEHKAEVAFPTQTVFVQKDSHDGIM